MFRYKFAHWEFPKTKRITPTLRYPILPMPVTGLPVYFATLAMRFMHSLCLGVNLGVAPAWFLYTLHGQQWTLGK